MHKTYEETFEFVKECILDIIDNRFDNVQAKVHLSSNLVNDLDFDDVEKIELVCCIEEELRIELCDDELDNLKTVEDWVKIIRQKQ